jgi:phage terminase small subunit
LNALLDGGCAFGEPIETDQLLSSRGHGSRLSVKAEPFVMATMTEKSIAAAARKAGISEATAYRYMKDPEVQALLVRRRDDAFRQNMARMGGLVGEALDMLAGMMTNEVQKPQFRIAAASKILDTAIPLRQSVELTDRLATLEMKQDGARA